MQYSPTLQTFQISITAFFLPPYFQKLSNLGASNFSFTSILLQTLHLTLCTFPFTSTIDSTQGSLHFEHLETPYFYHIPSFFLFSSIEIQRSTFEGSLKEDGTMFAVWLLDLASISIDSSSKIKQQNVKFYGGCKGAIL